MGSIDISKPLSTALSSAVHKSQQHQEKNSWECWVSNAGLMGEKQECYLCAMQPPLQFRSFLARNWPPAGLGRLTAPGFFRRCPKLSSARFNRRLTRPKTLGLSLTYILSLSLYLTHTHARTKTHTHTRTHLLTSLPLAFNLAVRNSAFFVQVHFEPIALLAESLNSRVKTPRRPTAPWTSLGLLRRFSFRSSCWKPTWCWSFECP